MGFSSCLPRLVFKIFILRFCAFVFFFQMEFLCVVYVSLLVLNYFGFCFVFLLLFMLLLLLLFCSRLRASEKNNNKKHRAASMGWYLSLYYLQRKVLNVLFFFFFSIYQWKSVNNNKMIKSKGWSYFLCRIFTRRHSKLRENGKYGKEMARERQRDSNC